MSKVLLVANGAMMEPAFLQGLAQEANFVLAADGGANQAAAAGVCPHVIIGDLDSLSLTTRARCPGAQIVHVENQNNTDLEKALDYLLARGTKHCLIAGALGGRWDFSFANFLAVAAYAGKMDISFAAENLRIYARTKGGTFACKKGGRVSVLPVTACENVSLSGLAFPLQNAHLPLGSGLTLSNRALADQFTLSFTCGYLLVYVEA